jgi:hypothetical protein
MTSQPIICNHVPYQLSKDGVIVSTFAVASAWVLPMWNDEAEAMMLLTAKELEMLSPNGLDILKAFLRSSLAFESLGLDSQSTLWETMGLIASMADDYQSAFDFNFPSGGVSHDIDGLVRRYLKSSAQVKALSNLDLPTFVSRVKSDYVRLFAACQYDDIRTFAGILVKQFSLNNTPARKGR